MFISDELADFLKVERGTKMRKSQAISLINEYIIRNNLQNGGIIHADEKLIKILNLKYGDDLTYFNMQKFLHHHFSDTKPEPVSDEFAEWTEKQKELARSLGSNITNEDIVVTCPNLQCPPGTNLVRNGMYHHCQRCLNTYRLN